MSGIESAPVSPSDPRWTLMLRVADSSYFCKGPKLRAFLLYVCENTLLGRPENVREQLIGAEVFGRSLEYNLAADNIVRVEAREVRKRLEAYFSGEGRDEPVIIEIPKGGYVPVFKPREQAPAAPDAKAPESNDANTSPEPKGRLAVPWVPLLATGLLIATGAAILAVGEIRHLRQQLPALRPGVANTDYSFYPRLLGTLGTRLDRDALLVLSNPGVTTYFGADSRVPLEDAPNRTVLAPKELKGSFGFALKATDRDLPFHFLRLNIDDFTGMGEAVAAFHLGRLMHYVRRPIRITQRRFLNWDHIQKQDLILLGGPESNDWTYQAGTKSNFNYQRDCIENVKPLAGEQKQYTTRWEGGTAVLDYGIVKLVTSPFGFSMLLVAGRTSAGTAGVGEFLGDAGKMRPVYERLRASAAGEAFPTDWELLLRIALRDDIPVETSVVALRPDTAHR